MKTVGNIKKEKNQKTLNPKKQTKKRTLADGF